MKVIKILKRHEKFKVVVDGVVVGRYGTDEEAHAAVDRLLEPGAGEAGRDLAKLRRA